MYDMFKWRDWCLEKIDCSLKSNRLHTKKRYFCFGVLLYVFAVSMHV